MNPNERILCCVGLRRSTGLIEQCLRIQKSLPQTDGSIRLEIREEWMPIPRKMSRSKYSRIDWAGMDWSKNDQQIARMTGVPAASVRHYRRKLGAPCSPGHVNGSHLRKIPEDLIASADWENQRDMDLAEKWGVSRERVRQIRMEREKPACKFHHVNKIQIEMGQWLNDHRKEIEGRPAHDVVREMPQLVFITTKLKALKKSGIPFDWSKAFRMTRLRSYDMNWSLPNLLLSMIWGERTWTVANYRCRGCLGKPKWTFGRFSRSWVKSGRFEQAVLREIEKAKAKGKNHGESVLDYLGARRKALA